MKIARVDCIPLRIPFDDYGSAPGLMPTKWTHLEMALVRVETTDGIVGWGDAFAYSCLSAVTAAIRDMVAPLVVGRDIEDIAAVNLELQRRLHLHGRYGITIFAISGVDVALWDAKAKAKGVSLAHLLGGRTTVEHSGLCEPRALQRAGAGGEARQAGGGGGLSRRQAARDHARSDRSRPQCRRAGHPADHRHQLQLVGWPTPNASCRT